jgi:hypothetical protein
MLWADVLRVLQSTRWEIWAMVLLGLGLGVLALVGGRLVFAAAPPAPPPPAAPETEEPVHDPFLMGSLSEKRQAARRKGGTVEVLVSDEKANGQPLQGHVVDRSLGGVCLRSKHRASVGEVLTLRPVDAPPGTPWVEVKVCTCRQESDSWLLGCQYVRVPPTSLRMLFG